MCPGQHHPLCFLVLYHDKYTVVVKKVGDPDVCCHLYEHECASEEVHRSHTHATAEVERVSHEVPINMSVARRVCCQ